MQGPNATLTSDAKGKVEHRTERTPPKAHHQRLPVRPPGGARHTDVASRRDPHADVPRQGRAECADNEADGGHEAKDRVAEDGDPRGLVAMGSELVGHDDEQSEGNGVRCDSLVPGAKESL